MLSRVWQAIVSYFDLGFYTYTNEKGCPLQFDRCEDGKSYYKCQVCGVEEFEYEDTCP